jgi:DNA invertase Pin-like site-specific DNA recombinase
MTMIGYARVSTADQTTDSQHDALTAVGCERLYTEKVSGALRERPQLDAMLDYAREGDTIVITKLDRLARSLSHLIELAANLQTRGIGLRVLDQGIDTTTPAGRLMFHMLGAIGEFERDLIRERTSAGLAAARERGRTGGRPPSMTPEKLAAAKSLIESGHGVKAAAEAIGVSRATLHRHLGD